MKEYIRDESKIHTASTVVLIINLLAWALAIGNIIALIVYPVKWVSLSLLAVILIWGIFSELYYDYYEQLKIKINSNTIEYSYRLNSNIVPSSNTVVKIKIKNITKIKEKRNSLIIYGDITKQLPLRKIMSLNKIEVKTNFGNEKAELVRNIKSLVQ